MAKSETSDSKAGYLSTLQRGLAVLELVATTDTEWSAREIAAARGLSLGVTYHLLRTLVHEGYLVRTPTNGFQLGSRLGMLFDKYQEQLKPAEHLIQTLHGLRALTGESSYITGWSNQSIAILYYLEGEGAVRVRRTAIGSSGNVHARASARAVLAFVPEAQLGRYVRAGDMTKLTDKTVTDPRVLLENLRTIRQTGLSFEQEEYSPGVGCLASPVLDTTGFAIAALGMSVALTVYAERFPELSRAVHHAAREASTQAGFRGAYPDLLALDAEPPSSTELATLTERSEFK